VLTVLTARAASPDLAVSRPLRFTSVIALRRRLLVNPASEWIFSIEVFRNSALSFARRNSRLAGCAVILPPERFELDLKNIGNWSVAHLGYLKRLVMRLRRHVVAFAGKMMRDQTPVEISSCGLKLKLAD
jgi:hypothetical protein